MHNRFAVKGDVVPPEAKYTPEEIIAAALTLVRREGLQALTARRLAAELGTSPRPIFTACGSIERVRLAVMEKAQALYAAYVEEGLRQSPPFKGVGEQYLKFAAEEPILFRLLFMRPSTASPPSIHLALAGMDRNYEQILRSVTDTYGLTREEGERLYGHLGIYTHGYAAMIATGMSEYDPETLSEQLTDVFTALLAKTKGGNSHAGTA